MALKQNIQHWLLAQLMSFPLHQKYEDTLPFRTTFSHQKHPLHRWIEEQVIATLPKNHNVSSVDIEQAIDTFYEKNRGTSALSQAFHRVADIEEEQPQIYRRMRNIDILPPLKPMTIQAITDAAVAISSRRYEPAIDKTEWMTAEQYRKMLAFSTIGMREFSIY